MHIKKWLIFGLLLLITITFVGLVYFFPSPPKYSEDIDSGTFASHQAAQGRNVFMFDPVHLRWAVYDKKGRRVGYGKAIGGKDYCSDINEPCKTVEGSFTVFRTEDADCTSKTFPIDENGGAPMPHCMFFHKGYAIHGSSHLPNHNASHGCIRVTQNAARWMNENYIKPGAMVTVLPYSEKQVS